MSRAYYNEFDPKSAAWLRELIKQGRIAPGDVDERSITEVHPSDLTSYAQCHFFAGIGGWSLALRLAGVPDDEPIWTGSCPCQPFAECGRGLGFADERHLWPAWFRIIEQCRPAIVFGEQVASKAALAWLDFVFADMEGANYSCAAADLCAASVGSPQIRQRLWWVSNSNNPRREGPIRYGEPNQARQERQTPRSESMRSIGGSWPPGLSELGSIPVLADGLPGRMGRCRGYGNAIVPQVAAEFIRASLEVIRDVSG